MEAPRRAQLRIQIAVIAVLGALLLAGQALGAVPGRNGRIAFASARTGTYELYSVAPDGTDLRRLTNDQFFDGFPTWSPDGRQLAFSSNRDGDVDLWVMDSSGANARQVTNGPGSDRDAAWSPDGTRLAFERDLPGGERDVWVVDIATGVETRLTTNPLVDGDPAWSPDGELIAYGSERPGDGPDEEVYFVFLMRPDGTQLGQLTDVGWDQDPSFSPDGGSVVFESAGDERGPWDLYVIDVETRVSRLLLDDPVDAVTPAWSPDGQEIAFLSQRTGNWHLSSIHPDGSGLRDLTTDPVSDWLDDSAPAWQPLGPPPADCTIVGTEGADILLGTPGPDVICGLGAADVIRGLGGADILRGGDGNDVITGGAGRDRLLGGAGNDDLRSRDGEADVVSGGAGRDRARADARLDRLRSIERRA